MASLNPNPFFKDFTIDENVNTSAIDLYYYNLLKADGLLSRKREHILFTDLKSVETYDTIFNDKGNQQLLYPDLELFVDPNKIGVQKKMNVNKQLTKGGYVNQFWGQDLPLITISANSGYFGLTKGRDPITATTLNILDRIGNAPSYRNGEQKTGYLDPLKVFEKLKTYVYDNRFDGQLPSEGNPIITMVYEGTAYSGYFLSFNYELNATKPFVIDYNLQFVVISPSREFNVFNKILSNFNSLSNVMVGTIYQGMTEGINSTVQGGLYAVSDATTSRLTKEAQKFLSLAAKNLGVKSTIDLTPSKIILA